MGESRLNNKIKLLAERAGFVFWNEESWGPRDNSIDWSLNYTKEFNDFIQLILESICEELSEQIKVLPKEETQLNYYFGYDKAIIDAMNLVRTYNK